MFVPPLSLLLLLATHVSSHHPHHHRLRVPAAHGVNVTCPAVGTTTFGIQPVYYSDFIPTNTIIDLDGSLISVTNAPTVLIIHAYVTTIITPSYISVSPPMIIISLDGNGTATSGQTAAPSSTASPASSSVQLQPQSTTSMLSPQTPTSSPLTSPPMSSSHTLFPPSVSDGGIPLSNNIDSILGATDASSMVSGGSSIAPEQSNISGPLNTASVGLVSLSSNSASPTAPLTRPVATSGVTPAITTAFPPLTIGDGIPAGRVTSLPAASRILLAFNDANVVPAGRAVLNRRQAVPQDAAPAPSPTSASPVSVVNLATVSVAAPAASSQPDTVYSDNCDAATPLVLSDGLLLYNGTAVNKYYGDTAALLGQLLADDVSDQVNSTFSFVDGFLQWLAPDVGQASFYSCDGTLWAGFPSLPYNCTQVDVGAVAAEACVQRVAATRSVNPALTAAVTGNASSASSTRLSRTASSSSSGRSMSVSTPVKTQSASSLLAFTESVLSASLTSPSPSTPTEGRSSSRTGLSSPQSSQVSDSSIVSGTTSNSVAATTPTSPTGLPVYSGCNQDNCLRNLADSRYYTSAQTFCASYTTSSAVPTPTWLENCNSDSTRISSACSCLLPATQAYISSSSSFTVRTVTASPTASTISGSSSSVGTPSLSSARSSTTPSGPLCTGQSSLGNVIGASNYQVLQPGSYPYEIECYAFLTDPSAGTLQPGTASFESCITQCDNANANIGIGSCQAVSFNQSTSACSLFSSLGSGGYPYFGPDARSARLISSSYPTINDAFYLQPESSGSNLGLCQNRAYSFDIISPQYQSSYDNQYENQCGRAYSGSSQIDPAMVQSYAGALGGNVSPGLQSSEDCLKACDYANHQFHGSCVVYNFDNSTNTCSLYGATDGTTTAEPTVNAGRLLAATAGYPSPTDRPTATTYVSKYQYVDAVLTSAATSSGSRTTSSGSAVPLSSSRSSTSTATSSPFGVTPMSSLTGTTTSGGVLSSTVTPVTAYSIPTAATSGNAVSAVLGSSSGGLPYVPSASTTPISPSGPGATGSTLDPVGASLVAASAYTTLTSSMGIAQSYVSVPSSNQASSSTLPSYLSSTVLSTSPSLPGTDFGRSQSSSLISTTQSDSQVSTSTFRSTLDSSLDVQSSLTQSSSQSATSNGASVSTMSTQSDSSGDPLSTSATSLVLSATSSVAVSTPSGLPPCPLGVVANAAGGIFAVPVAGGYSASCIVGSVSTSSTTPAFLTTTSRFSSRSSSTTPVYITSSASSSTSVSLPPCGASTTGNAGPLHNFLTSHDVNLNVDVTICIVASIGVGATVSIPSPIVCGLGQTLDPVLSICASPSSLSSSSSTSPTPTTTAASNAPNCGIGAVLDPVLSICVCTSGYTLDLILQQCVQVSSSLTSTSAPTSTSAGSGSNPGSCGTGQILDPILQVCICSNGGLLDPILGTCGLPSSPSSRAIASISSSSVVSLSSSSQVTTATATTVSCGTGLVLDPVLNVCICTNGGVLDPILGTCGPPMTCGLGQILDPILHVCVCSNGGILDPVLGTCGPAPATPSSSRAITSSYLATTPTSSSLQTSSFNSASSSSASNAGSCGSGGVISTVTGLCVCSSGYHLDITVVVGGLVQCVPNIATSSSSVPTTASTAATTSLTTSIRSSTSTTLFSSSNSLSSSSTQSASSSSSSAASITTYTQRCAGSGYGYSDYYRSVTGLLASTPVSGCESLCTADSTCRFAFVYLVLGGATATCQLSHNAYDATKLSMGLTVGMSYCEEKNP